MSTAKQSSASRLLWFLKSKTEPGMKGNTIKKIAPGIQANAVTPEEPIMQSSVEVSNFPREYYTPRPVPKCFVVGEVRKLSNDGSPPDSISDRQKVAGPAAATQMDDTIEANSIVKTFDHSVIFTTPSLGSQSPNRPVLGSPTTQTRTTETKPLSSGLNGERRQWLTFELLLGQQDPASPYFTRRYFSEPYTADTKNAFDPPKDILYHITELDPQAFDIYKTYTHTGKIGLRCSIDVKADHVWIACWPLMNAHILGCIIEEFAFADRVMDTMSEKLTLANAPDLETVEHLFDDSRKGIPAVLKVFVVDHFIYAQQRSCNILETSNHPALFKETALQAALRHLAYDRSTTVRTGCEYHVHGDKEACYKTRLTPANTLKEQRLAAARENSARDAEFVAVNALQNSVKSVDWEHRRASANQALRIETGQM